MRRIFPHDMFELAGRLALASHHPVAAAVARAAKAKMPLSTVEEVSGQGVRAVVNGVEVRLGRPSFCDADQIADDILARDPKHRLWPSVTARSVTCLRSANVCVRMRLRSLPGSNGVGSRSKSCPEIVNRRCGTPRKRSGFTSGAPA